MFLFIFYFKNKGGITHFIQILLNTLLNVNLSILNGKYRASRMGANFEVFAFKKSMSEANTLSMLLILLLLLKRHERSECHSL